MAASTATKSLQRFAEKVVVCTASTSGIGFATARRIGREGAKVVICSRKQENVDKAVDELLKEGLEVSGIAAHQGQEKDRKRLIDFTLEKYGGIDALFCSAGVNPHVGITHTLSEAQFDKLFEVNVKATFDMIKECIPHLKQRGGGSVLTNATCGAFFPENVGQVVGIGNYAMCKLSVISLSKILAMACVKDNIRVNCIAPGEITTPFMEGMYKIDKEGKARNELQSYVIMGRAGMPEECAAVAAFLLSDDASFLTGDTIPICGGSAYYRY